MNTDNVKKGIIVLLLCTQIVSAATTDPAAIIKGLICSIWTDFTKLIGPLATLMFVYGGAKYAYSADDPGGRKQAKAICINAIIGLLIAASARAIVAAAGASGSICP
ncbi:MAG: TrbC/VirB2 family protein [Candidatus Altiarchaeota archaeon]